MSSVSVLTATRTRPLEIQGCGKSSESTTPRPLEETLPHFWPWNRRHRSRIELGDPPLDLSGPRSLGVFVHVAIRKVIDAIKDGFAGPELKAETDELQSRKEPLLAQLAAADAPVPLLHPNLTALYREKVTSLAAALQHVDSRSEAAEALRGPVDAIVLVPAGSELRIELKGNLAAMLSAAQNAKRSPEGDLSLQIAMVAGARNRRYLQLWSVAER